MSTSFRSSPISMQMKGSSLDGHTPRTQGTSSAAGDLNTRRAKEWDAKKPCPWPMEEYERALNCEYSPVRQNGAVLTIFDLRHRRPPNTCCPGARQLDESFASNSYHCRSYSNLFEYIWFPTDENLSDRVACSCTRRNVRRYWNAARQ